MFRQHYTIRTYILFRFPTMLYVNVEPVQFLNFRRAISKFRLAARLLCPSLFLAPTFQR